MTILGNVFRYTPQGTAFEVEHLAPGRNGRRSVIDDALHRESPIRRRRCGVARATRGSTGLGLDIARRAAQSAGGSVSLDRAATGGASTLMLLADPEAAPKQVSRFGLVGRLARERGGPARPPRVTPGRMQQLLSPLA